VRPRRALLLALALLLPACGTTQTRYRDWSQYDGPGAAEFSKPEPPPPPALPDPLQPVNRAMFDFNVGVLDWVAAPLSDVWLTVTSRGVRRHISQFRENLKFPIRLVANLLEGEPGRAGVETSRFLINTTIGLLGFFDPAVDMGIEAPDPEDFGQVFGTWGWQSQFYVQLPFAGPSSDRDATGFIFDTALNPATYFFGLEAFLYFNDLSDRVDPLLRLQHASEDPYEVVRTGYTLYRAREVVDYSGLGDVSPELETLGAITFDAQDPEFFGRRRTRNALVPATDEDLPYELWLQDAAAPLVFVLPGLGSHRLSGQAVGLAEMAFDAGCSVVTISSVMHPEFMQDASTAPLPGYLPWDTADLRHALAAVAADLEDDYPGRFTRRGLAGLSLGGLEALALACGPGGDDFDAVVAVDPPVSVEHALQQLDRLYRAPLKWPDNEREARIRNLLLKVVALAGGSLETTQQLPFAPLEAEYLIGLSFRWTLRSVIFDSQLRDPLGVLLTPLHTYNREPAYREIGEYGFMEYAYAFMLPAVQARDPEVYDGPTLFDRCDLHTLQPALASDTRLRVDFRQATLQDRLVLFEEGGHLGNLGKPAVRQAITDSLRQALGVPPQN
jgi:phospholipid-binding lipoprotein MlaA